MEKILYLISELVAEVKAMNDKIERQKSIPQCDFECSHCTRQLVLESPELIDPIKIDEDVESILPEVGDCQLITTETISQNTVNIDGGETADSQNAIEIAEIEEPFSENYAESIVESYSLSLKEEFSLQEPAEVSSTDERNPLEPHVILFHESGDTSREESDLQKEKAPEPNKNQCSFCGKQFEFRSYLRRHEITHTKSRPYKCYGCQKTFPHQWNVYKHESVCPASFFTCDKCGEKFEDPELCRVHVRKHFVASAVDSWNGDMVQASYSCPICDKEYKTSASLKQHMLSHAESRLLRCCKCQKTFRHMNTLKGHLRKSHCIGTGVELV